MPTLAGLLGRFNKMTRVKLLLSTWHSKCSASVEDGYHLSLIRNLPATLNTLHLFTGDTLNCA